LKPWDESKSNYNSGTNTPHKKQENQEQKKEKFPKIELQSSKKGIIVEKTLENEISNQKIIETPNVVQKNQNICEQQKNIGMHNVVQKSICQQLKNIGIPNVVQKNYRKYDEILRNNRTTSNQNSFIANSYELNIIIKINANDHNIFWKDILKSIIKDKIFSATIMINGILEYTMFFTAVKFARQIFSDLDINCNFEIKDITI
jgi:hypothetical protein